MPMNYKAFETFSMRSCAYEKSNIFLFLISFGVAFIFCSRDKDGNNESAERTYDFRNVRWGMSQAEVLESEKLTPSTKRPDLILYSGE